MIYTRITNTTAYRNPRFIFECPNELTLQEAKKVFGCKIATDKQAVSVYNNNMKITCYLIFVTYNVAEVVGRLKKYTFLSDSGNTKPLND